MNVNHTERNRVAYNPKGKGYHTSMTSGDLVHADHLKVTWYTIRLKKYGLQKYPGGGGGRVSTFSPWSIVHQLYFKSSFTLWAAWHGAVRRDIFFPCILHASVISHMQEAGISGQHVGRKSAFLENLSANDHALRAHAWCEQALLIFNFCSRAVPRRTTQRHAAHMNEPLVFTTRIWTSL